MLTGEKLGNELALAPQNYLDGKMKLWHIFWESSYVRSLYFDAELVRMCVDHPMGGAYSVCFTGVHNYQSNFDAEGEFIDKIVSKRKIKVKSFAAQNDLGVIFVQFDYKSYSIDEL